MAKIVNLRTEKKRRARAEAQAKAAENRAAFGRTKADKSETRARDDKARRDLDAHKRED